MSDPEYEAISKAKRQKESANFKGAAETLENYLRTDPHNTKARLLLANIYYYDLKDEDYGSMQMEIILDLEPDNVEALKASVTVLKKNKKNNALTVERFEKLLALAPCGDIYNSYALFLKMQMTDYEKSAEYYRKAIASDPKRHDYHQNYAVLLLKDLKDYPKAKEELEIVMKLNPGNPAVKKNYDLLMKKKFDSGGNLKKKKFGFGR